MEPLTASLLAFAATVLYLAPTFIAHGNRKRRAGTICALNVVLGWVTVGWVPIVWIGALVWSLTRDGT
jgi:hypothetical protein